MSSPELLAAVPYWTEKMYPAEGGQDHLGLGSVVTDRVLPRLSPGINVLTITGSSAQVLHDMLVIRPFHEQHAVRGSTRQSHPAVT